MGHGQKSLQPFSNALALVCEGDEERRVRFDDHDSPRLETSFAIARPSIKERLYNHGNHIGIEHEDTVAASARTAPLECETSREHKLGRQPFGTEPNVFGSTSSGMARRKDEPEEERASQQATQSSNLKYGGATAALIASAERRELRDLQSRHRASHTLGMMRV